jgi:hypothetical protein
MEIKVILSLFYTMMFFLMLVIALMLSMAVMRVTNSIITDLVATEYERFYVFANTNPETVLHESLDVEIHDHESDQNASITVDEHILTRWPGPRLVGERT